MKTHRPLSPAGLLIRFLALVLTAMAFSSCHTTAGFGEDLRHVGNKIESSAQRVH